MILPLEMLQAGERGKISELHGRPEVVHRLQEMGLREGATVEMVRPGSPCILTVDHHRFSVRLDEAATVFVELHSSPMSSREEPLSDSLG